MDILSFKPGHDGHIAYIKNGKLEFSIEAEKDGGVRYSAITPRLYLKALQYVSAVPDIFAVGGWLELHRQSLKNIDAKYDGCSEEQIISRSQNFLGKRINFFSSSHERSHLLCSYALSPFPQGQPCYALVWEGVFGTFYRIDEKLRISRIGEVMSGPGVRYQMLYGLADPSFGDDDPVRMEDAGKLMALTSYGDSRPPNEREAEILESLLFRKLRNEGEFWGGNKNWKRDLNHTIYYNIGVESEEFKQLAKIYSDALFEQFFRFAEQNLHERIPLLISGGCGLNCDWNSAWKRCGLFSDVFVPPCTNDSGAAIGTAVDALYYHTGNAKIDWDVYAGEHFVMDEADMTGLAASPLDFKEVADFLRQGNIIAWVQGRYEIGPRALGNRSIFAMPFTKDIHLRLNAIKKREGFRPIAPICLEEDMDLLFEHHGPSPHMLYFQRVLTGDLPAITHVDGSARVQSINKKQNPQAYELLVAFKAITGFGVLCNTSLNFNGTGFINRMSDLVGYCRSRSLDGFVVNDKFYKFN